MPINDLLPNIVNLAEVEAAVGKPLRDPDALQQHGYRLMKARDADRYYLAKDPELQPLLVRLGDIAEVRFGIKTGANEFFYLEPVGMRVADLIRSTGVPPVPDSPVSASRVPPVPDSPVSASRVPPVPDSPVSASRVPPASVSPAPTVRVKNGAGWEGEIEASWLRPVIKSPRELKTLRVRPEDLRYLVFMPPDAIREQLPLLTASGELKKRYPKAWAYIQWGEKQGYQDNPTMRARDVWYNLVAKESQILLLRATANRPAFYYSVFCILHDQTFYSVHHDAKVDTSVYVSLLNSTLSNHLSRELISGASAMLGQGALWSAVYETQDMLLTNPSALTPSQRERLLHAFEQMAQREVKSIFEELGLPKPNRDYSNIDPSAVSLDKVLPDRRALDAVVFEVLGLSETEQLEVYRAVVELVKSRLVKAQSVG